MLCARYCRYQNKYGILSVVGNGAQEIRDHNVAHKCYGGVGFCPKGKEGEGPSVSCQAVRDVFPEELKIKKIQLILKDKQNSDMKLDIRYRIFPRDMKNTANLRNSNTNTRSSLGCNKSCVWDMAKNELFLGSGQQFLSFSCSSQTSYFRTVHTSV